MKFRDALASVQGILRLLLAFLGKKNTLISRLRKQVLGHDTLQWRSFSLTNIKYINICWEQCRSQVE